MAVSFGIKTTQMGLNYEEIQGVWLEADQIPEFEHAWLWDHLIPLRGDATAAALEAWTLLAALAAQTRRLKLGVIVTSNQIRRPAVLAKMAATVDQIAGGRLVFGIGAGYARTADPQLTAIAEREYGAYGIDVISVGTAISALGEALEIFRKMWTEVEPFDFAGTHYHLTGAICEPKPVQRPAPPVLIGAGGERRSPRLVAEHADIWNCPTRGDGDELRHKRAVLDEHCAAIGRDPAEIATQVQVMVRADDLDAARRQISECIDAGAEQVVLALLPPWPSNPARWLADEVVAGFR
jgi:alkanesulfonate monooxygenase SsuD/methylene tetrahydromethanopterin reductase-like flavin-dependent oxidoreductase (luciferase family)